MEEYKESDTRVIATLLTCHDVKYVGCEAVKTIVRGQDDYRVYCRFTPRDKVESHIKTYYADTLQISPKILFDSWRVAKDIVNRAKREASEAQKNYRNLNNKPWR